MPSFLEKAAEDILERDPSRRFSVKVVALLENLKAVPLKDGILLLVGKGFEIPKGRDYLEGRREDIKEFMREEYLISLIMDYQGPLEKESRSILPPCDFRVQRLPWFLECLYIFSEKPEVRGYCSLSEIAISSKWIVGLLRGVRRSIITIVYMKDLSERDFEEIYQFLLRAVMRISEETKEIKF